MFYISDSLKIPPSKARIRGEQIQFLTSLKIGEQIQFLAFLRIGEQIQFASWNNGALRGYAGGYVYR